MNTCGEKWCKTHHFRFLSHLWENSWGICLGRPLPNSERNGMYLDRILPTNIVKLSCRVTLSLFVGRKS